MAVKIVGIEKFARALDRASGQSAKVADAVVKNTTEKGQKVAKSKAPVDTSFLKDNIVTEYPETAFGVVHSQAYYSGFQEYGTRFMSPQPFMRPMLREVVPEFKKDLTKEWKNVVK